MVEQSFCETALEHSDAEEFKEDRLLDVLLFASQEGANVFACSSL